MKHSKTIDTAYVGQDFDAFQAEDGKSAAWKILHWLQGAYTRSADQIT